MSKNAGYGQDPDSGNRQEDNQDIHNSQNPKRGHGKQLGQRISESVMGALQTGDLSKLNEIGTAIQDAVKDIPGVTSGSPNNKPVQYAKPVTPKVNNPAWMGSAGGFNKKRRGPSGGTGILSIVLGSFFTASFGIALLVTTIVSLSGAAAVFEVAAMMSVFTAMSGLALYGGISKRRLAKATWTYYDLLAAKPVRTFQELAQCTGKSVNEVKREVRKAMRRGYLKDVRVDDKETCLIYGEDSYHLYLQTEDARRQQMLEEQERNLLLTQNSELAALEEFKKKGATTIREIRAANEALPGEEISEKLSRLESVTAKIFAYVEKHPEKLPDTRKFMDYYLPTSLKLVNKYRQYEEHEVQVDNILKAKQEIEQTLETINVAFNNLLNNLYQDDTLDVSTDIEVLQTMLAQEGLTGNQFEIGSVDADNNPLHL